MEGQPHEDAGEHSRPHMRKEALGGPCPARTSCGLPSGPVSQQDCPLGWGSWGWRACTVS